MNRIKSSFLALAFITAGSHAMCQISKSEATAFITSHTPSGVSRFWVIEQIQYNAAGNDFARDLESFDPATVVMKAMETSILIKDGSGKEIYVPYSQVKYLMYQPETDKLYSNITISVK